jgi:formamidopyrimidine-DNA glycosylase
MPELPEVETITVDLRPHLVGSTILECTLCFPGIVRHPEPERFVSALRGRPLRSLTRRGKYILAALDAGDLLVVHLGMSGQLSYVEPNLPLLAHTHAIFSLRPARGAGRAELRYRDIRRFGRLLLGTEAELLQAGKLPRLGPEPLDPRFSPDDLYRRLRGRRAPLKALLLDQSVLAGVGNIYADESCFKAGIRPDRPGGRLSRTAVVRLHRALRETLTSGISHRGSSVDDYLDAWGEPGSHQGELQVYGHAGQPCPTCSRPLALVRLAGRSTVFCRRCQH